MRTLFDTSLLKQGTATMRATIMGLLAVGLLAGPMEVSATIIVGGIEFADDAFATQIVSTNVPPGHTFPVGTPLEDAILGSDVNKHVDTSFGNFIELGFDQGVLRNRPGPDLAVFDVTSDSDPFSISLTVGGPTFPVPQDISFSLVGTNDFGFDLRVFLFDLALLGVSDNATLDSIVVSTPIGSVEFTAFGALVQVAEPSTLTLLCLGLVGLGFGRRLAAYAMR